MRYFGTKQVAEIDEDAIAAERLTAIAGRFKPNPSDDVVVDRPDSAQEGPQAPEIPN